MRTMSVARARYIDACRLYRLIRNRLDVVTIDEDRIRAQGLSLVHKLIGREYFDLAADVYAWRHGGKTDSERFTERYHRRQRELGIRRDVDITVQYGITMWSVRKEPIIRRRRTPDTDARD